jgi:1,4-alpha-glucan branching enzyme
MLASCATLHYDHTMQRRQSTRITTCIVLMMISASAPAQTPPKIISPESMPGGRVAFQIYSPKAHEIQLSGDWMGRDEGLLALTKGPDSVWTIVTDGPRPNIYTYKFIVDGVEAIDPASWHSVLDCFG